MKWALRKRAFDESDEMWTAYKRSRRAQQMAIVEKRRAPRAPRDRTGRNRPEREAKKNARQQHVPQRLDDSHLITSPPLLANMSSPQKLKWVPPSRNMWCSCNFGVPCDSIMTCVDWHARYQVAARNGWKPPDRAIPCGHLSMSQMTDHFGQWLADRSARLTLSGRPYYP